MNNSSDNSNKSTPENTPKQRATKISCEVCKGVGLIKYDIIVCDICEGKKCIKCNSRGLLRMPYDECYKCYGDGYVTF
jgi:hypothetical protein